MRIRLAISAVVVWLGAVAPFVACGIDESGLLNDASQNDVLGGGDAPKGDAGIDVVYDNYVPPVCSQLDASCLGTTLPTGWEPFAIQIGVSSVTCPGDGGDFSEVAYEADATVVGNACVCTACSEAAGWSCSGTLNGGATCSDQSQAVGNTPYCWVSNHTHFSGTVARSGAATCTPSTYFVAEAGASTTSVAGCAPTQCTSDFCGLGATGFKLCARNASVTDGTCPPGLTISHVVGVSSHVACNACPTCTVLNADAGCSATLSAFSGTDCDAGPQGSGPADNSCNPITFNSLLYQPTLPTPQCSSNGPTNVGGTGVLDGKLTICCLN